MIRVEFLYFDGCPGHEAAWELLGQEISDLGIPADIEKVRVKSPDEAAELRFLGSPSIRIDGADLEGEAAERETGYGWRCRFYADSQPGAPKAVPSRELIRRRLREASTA